MVQLAFSADTKKRVQEELGRAFKLNNFRLSVDRKLFKKSSESLFLAPMADTCLAPAGRHVCSAGC